MKKMGIIGATTAALATLGATLDPRPAMELDDAGAALAKEHKKATASLKKAKAKRVALLGAAEREWRERKGWQRKPRVIALMAARVPAELPEPLTRQLKRQIERHRVKRIGQAHAPMHHHTHLHGHLV